MYLGLTLPVTPATKPDNVFRGKSYNSAESSRLELAKVQNCLSVLENLLIQWPLNYSRKICASTISPASLSHLSLKCVLINFIQKNSRLKNPAQLPPVLADEFISFLIKTNPSHVNEILRLIALGNYSIENLDLSGTTVTDEGLEYLSAWPNLVFLKVLNISNCIGITKDGLSLLDKATNLDSLIIDGCHKSLLTVLPQLFSRLSVLSAARMNLLLGDLTTLASHSLVSLNVSSNIALWTTFGNNGFPSLPTVKALYMKYNVCCDIGLLAQIFPNLELLDAEGCTQTSRTAGKERLWQLKDLQVTLDPSWYQSGASLFPMGNLLRLKISSKYSGNPVLKQIAAEGKQLTHLKCHLQVTSEEDLQTLLTIPQLRKLTLRDFSQVSVKGLMSLSSLKELHVLSLNSNLITDDTVFIITSHKKLVHLELQNAALTLAGVMELLEKMPHLETLTLINCFNLELCSFQWPQKHSLKKLVVLGSKEPIAELVQNAKKNLNFLYIPSVAALYDSLIETSLFADLVRKPRLLCVCPKLDAEEDIVAVRSWFKIMKRKSTDKVIKSGKRIFSLKDSLRNAQKGALIEKYSFVLTETHRMLDFLSKLNYWIFDRFNVRYSKSFPEPISSVFKSEWNLGRMIVDLSKNIQMQMQAARNKYTFDLDKSEINRKMICMALKNIGYGLNLFTEPQFPIDSVIEVQCVFREMIMAIRSLSGWSQGIHLQFYKDLDGSLSCGLKFQDSLPLTDQSFKSFMELFVNQLILKKTNLIDIHKTVLPFVAIDLSHVNSLSTESLKYLSSLNAKYPELFKISYFIVKDAHNLLKAPNCFGRSRTQRKPYARETKIQKPSMEEESSYTDIGRLLDEQQPNKTSTTTPILLEPAERSASSTYLNLSSEMGITLQNLESLVNGMPKLEVIKINSLSAFSF